MGKGIALQAGAEEDDRQSRRDVEPLLGAGDADGRANLVHGEVLGKEGTDHVHYQGNAKPSAYLTYTPDVKKNSGGGLMMLHEQGVGSGPGKGRFQRIIVQILAELHFV